MERRRRRKEGGTLVWGKWESWSVINGLSRFFIACTRGHTGQPRAQRRHTQLRDVCVVQGSPTWDTTQDFTSQNTEHSSMG